MIEIGGMEIGAFGIYPFNICSYAYMWYNNIQAVAQQ